MKLKNVYISITFYVILCNLYAQESNRDDIFSEMVTINFSNFSPVKPNESLSVNSFERDSGYIFIEKLNKRRAEEIPDYVDSFPDTLFYNNRILFFRQTPLSLKTGYSNVYLADKDEIELFSLNINNGVRGYHLTWIVRNDSLFIKRIYVVPWWIDPIVFSEDSLHARMEKFTGGHIINGLLFVDWISGDLRVISKYCGYGGHFWSIYAYGNGRGYSTYNDDRKYGHILTIKDGLVIQFNEDRTNNHTGQNHIVQREWDYEFVKKRSIYYVDSEPDTLIHGGRKYLFRQSPLSLKNGYTDVYHEDEVSIYNITSDGGILGMKGYHLTWITRNDSLFISDIYPTYYDPRRPTLLKDTIISRMEAFTGGRFINGLLFVKWISGYFGIITKHTRNFREIIDEIKTNETHELEYNDDRKYGSFMEIKNGIIMGFSEEDNRLIKN